MYMFDSCFFFMIYGHVSELYFGRVLRYVGKRGVGVPEYTGSQSGILDILTHLMLETL